MKEEDIQHLSEELAVLLSDAPDDDFEGLDLDNIIDEEARMNWGTGCEQWQNMPLEQIYEVLGVEPHKLPMTAKLVDLNNCEDPWSHTLVLGKNNTNVVELKLRWHQAVALYKMVLNAFNGDPILEMDTVGVGKTLPVVWLFATLRYFRRYYAEHKMFPGSFRKQLILFLVVNRWD